MSSRALVALIVSLSPAWAQEPARLQRTYVLTGWIERSAERVALVNPDRSWKIEPGAQATLLGSFADETVRVRAVVDGESLRVVEVLSPKRRRLVGVAQVVNGHPALDVAASGTTTQLEATGSAAKVLRHVVGKRIECDAWVFSDVAGVERMARIEWIAGRARSYSLLASRPERGVATGFVREDQPVRVLDVSGGRVRVRTRNGGGWLSPVRVDLDEVVPPRAGVVEALSRR